MLDQGMICGWWGTEGCDKSWLDSRDSCSLSQSHWPCLPPCESSCAWPGDLSAWISCYKLCRQTSSLLCEFWGVSAVHLILWSVYHKTTSYTRKVSLQCATSSELLNERFCRKLCHSQECDSCEGFSSSPCLLMVQVSQLLDSLDSHTLLSQCSVSEFSGSLRLLSPWGWGWDQRVRLTWLTWGWSVLPELSWRSTDPGLLPRLLQCSQDSLPWRQRAC